MVIDADVDIEGSPRQQLLTRQDDRALRHHLCAAMNETPLQLNDFDYHLPEELIAQSPLEDRSASRLLHLQPSTGEIQHRTFRDVLTILRPGDILVRNNTFVSAVRLLGFKPTGASVEFLLLSEVEPGVFEALIKPAKRLQPGAIALFGPESTPDALVGEVLPSSVSEDSPKRLVRMRAKSGDLYDALGAQGRVPLPPYIKETLSEDARYQTVYANIPGSAAAPTAGLHFTDEVLNGLRALGVKLVDVTLNVSIDTFRPVEVRNVEDHRMHGEECSISEESADILNRALALRGTHQAPRIIAVGTTSVRTLETFARHDENGRVTVSSGSTISKIFIYPGYQWKVVDGMFTNFHMPKTTMLMMISSLTTRERIMEAYRQAVEQRYRFLSFGDSMLILE